MEEEDVGLHLPEGKASPLLNQGRQSVFDEGDPGYRAEKDRFRTRYTGRRGLRRINEDLYRLGLRPMYVEHGAPYRPTIAARLYALVRFLRVHPWNDARS
jgi:hypothetical protein